jgi:hypothetical protein
LVNVRLPVSTKANAGAAGSGVQIMAHGPVTAQPSVELAALLLSDCGLCAGIAPVSNRYWRWRFSKQIMSALGTLLLQELARAGQLCPGTSDIRLLRMAPRRRLRCRDNESALDVRVIEQQVGQLGGYLFARRSGCFSLDAANGPPKRLASSPILAPHLSASRAYCRVATGRFGFRGLWNRKTWAANRLA